MDKFDQWCVVEVMGHKKFAGRVTEGPFGLVQIDVPEVTLSSGQIVPPFSKMLGAHAIYAMTPCTEETARAFAKEFRSQAFQTYELPALTAPKASYDPERDPENEWVTQDVAHGRHTDQFRIFHIDNPGVWQNCIPGSIGSLGYRHGHPINGGVIEFRCRRKDFPVSATSVDDGEPF